MAIVIVSPKEKGKAMAMIKVIRKAQKQPAERKTQRAEMADNNANTHKEASIDVKSVQLVVRPCLALRIVQQRAQARRLGREVVLLQVVAHVQDLAGREVGLY